MAIHNKTEEQIKDAIYNLFTRCRTEKSPDRKPVLTSQLCEKIFIWCRDYLFTNEAEKLGLEIFNFTMRIVREDSKANIPTDKKEFIKYLFSSLKKERAGYYRKYESGLIKITKENKSKIKAVEDTIRMKECFLGRNLTEDEQSQCISKWFKKQEYIDLKNKIYANSPSDIDKVGVYDDPLNTYLLKIDTEIIQKAVKLVLDKKQERSKDCYKELFTLFCFENNLDMLYPVLDNEILEACYEYQQKPKQYEIYLKYHPEAKKASAEAIASKMLKDFINDLKENLDNLI